MKHNTDTLGYKLLSGQLREKRKHSEQLNKYLAGYLDADGCLGLSFSKYKDYYTTSLTFCFQQSFSADPDGSLLKALRDFYNLGKINYRDLSGDFSSVVVWTMGSDDFLKLYNLVGKHLRIKGTHWENLIWLYKELRFFHLSLNQLDDLKVFSKCSRLNSSWLKRPKHLSYAWLAGYFDGDGHYRIRHRRKYVKSVNRWCNSHELCVQVSCDKNDQHIIDKIVEDFGGTKHTHKQGHIIWKRSLGKTNSNFAIGFLKKLRSYSCLEKKYLIINDMIQFHDDCQQRLNKNSSKE